MNTFIVTLDEDGLYRTYLMKADSFEQAYYHLKEAHPEAQIMKIEVVIGKPADN